jgi:uncharacterized membrane protein
MDPDFALVIFRGVNSATEAFAVARDRPGATPPWAREVGFVEHHHDGHLVLRGTFAGHYVDADEALHVSERGAAEGWGVGAVIGALLGPPGFAAGMVLGATIGSEVGRPSEVDSEPQLLADRLRAVVPRSGSAIVLIAGANNVDGLLAAVGNGTARVIRKTLTPDDAAALQASLSASPAASPGPSTMGEEAIEESREGAS